MLCPFLPRQQTGAFRFLLLASKCVRLSFETTLKKERKKVEEKSVWAMVCGLRRKVYDLPSKMEVLAWSCTSWKWLNTSATVATIRDETMYHRVVDNDDSRYRFMQWKFAKPVRELGNRFARRFWIEDLYIGIHLKRCAGDANPIHTLGYYSKPSHEGYKNTIELPVGNNEVPLRSDTIRLVQNGCSFHGLRFEDPNQDLKDLLKLVDSLDLDGSITTWKDLTTRFLDHFFLPGRTTKLYNNILIQTIDQLAGVKLRNKNAKESWVLLEDLSLYDNEIYNNPRDFAKPIKAISLPQDVLSISDRRLIKLKNQVQHLMEAHLAPTQPTQENKILPHVKSVVVLTTLSIAWNIPNKPLLNVHPHKPIRREVERNVKTSITKYEDHDMTMESEDESKEETGDEIKEEEEEDSPKHFDTFPTMKKLRCHEWLLKNPRPPWVKAKVRTENLNNVKFSCMIGHFDKKQAYIDMESLINVMCMLHYNWIMSKRLGPRRKPSNPGKIYNFMGRVKGIKVFIGNFTYECNFMVLEDTTSVIDHDLGSVIFGKPFIEATALVYDIEEGTITFEK
nr:MAK10-like protein [Tanacetum cinerariifolium]